MATTRRRNNRKSTENRARTGASTWPTQALDKAAELRARVDKGHLTKQEATALFVTYCEEYGLLDDDPPEKR